MKSLLVLEMLACLPDFEEDSVRVVKVNSLDEVSRNETFREVRFLLDKRPPFLQAICSTCSASKDDPNIELALQSYKAGNIPKSRLLGVARKIKHTHFRRRFCECHEFDFLSDLVCCSNYSTIRSKGRCMSCPFAQMFATKGW